MVQHLKCKWCGDNVIYDTSQDNPHPDRTVYWRANGHPDNMVHVYCDASCALAWHEIIGKENE